MTDFTIRPAYSSWAKVNTRLRQSIDGLTEEQLAIQPTPERWPIWATIGHLACQRVFWLCDVAGEAGKDTTPFPNAAYKCPGDDDVWHTAEVNEALSGVGLPLIDIWD